MLEKTMKIFAKKMIDWPQQSNGASKWVKEKLLKYERRRRTRNSAPYKQLPCLPGPGGGASGNAESGEAEGREYAIIDDFGAGCTSFVPKLMP